MNDEKIVYVQTELLKIQYDKEESEFNSTYTFVDEDHTLGNLLRYILMKNKNTLFCGYSVPHPSENLMNIRLQSAKEKTNDILINSFDTALKSVDIIKKKFDIALKNFDKKCD